MQTDSLFLTPSEDERIDFDNIDYSVFEDPDAARRAIALIRKTLDSDFMSEAADIMTSTSVLLEGNIGFNANFMRLTNRVSVLERRFNGYWSKISRRMAPRDRYLFEEIGGILRLGLLGPLRETLDRHDCGRFQQEIDQFPSIQESIAEMPDGADLMDILNMSD